MPAWKIAGLILISSLLGEQVADAQKTAPSPQALAAAERLILASGFDKATFDPPARSSIDSVRDDIFLSDCAASSAEHPTENIDCKGNFKAVSQMGQSLRALRDQQKPNLLHAADNAYATHLSIDEMKTAAAFFESPTGRHLIAALPAISADYRAENLRIMETALTVPRSK